MANRQLCILGSTSHIARGLIHSFLQLGGVDLHLFTRSGDKLTAFLSAECGTADAAPVVHGDYADFHAHHYDVIINCVGPGTLAKMGGDFTSYFTLGEHYDKLVLDYLNNHRDALYISFSSGSVYGRGHAAPFEEGTCNSIMVNHVQKEDYYAITRIYHEAKHRAFKTLNIVDLRIFSYFSRYIELSDGYFITDILECIRNDRTLVTSNNGMVRDYLHPDDLLSMIIACINAGRINAAFDAVSAKPVDKSSILEFFSREYGLRYTFSDSFCSDSATGHKQIYCTRHNTASAVGYLPAYTSMDTLALESRHILTSR